MKLFAFRFNDDSKLFPDNYHDGGGLAVLADSREAAEALIRAQHPALDWEQLTGVTEHGASEVVGFADAGCC
jgi:hypothetical protein